VAEHISSKKTYIVIWAILICFTVITAAVSRVDLGQFSGVVALIIATIKAMLVVLFFMHVKYISEKMTLVVIIAGVFWLLILMFLSMTDYASRSWT
jgi:cytochrome c oxidase subunit IV